MDQEIKTPASVKKEKPQLRESIYSLLPDQLQDWLKEHGEKPFRAAQIFDWLYIKRVTSFDEMLNLSKGLRDKLQQESKLY